MSFSERLQQVIDNQYDGNKSKFSKKSDIPYTSVVEFANGTKSDPKLSMVIKILEVIGYENLLWLTCGVGELVEKRLSATTVDKMLKEDPKVNRTKITALEEKVIQLQESLDERGRMIAVQSELIETLRK